VVESLSKTQIDRLGERLRTQVFGEAELRVLDEYRRTFGPVYDEVVEKVQHVIGIPVSGRPAKSTTSIIEKLNRESIRLSQMQDISGCRAIVADVPAQDVAVNAIAEQFRDVAISDRRAKPSHGYRAVHLVVRESGKTIEVQIRTFLQHTWAELSEKCADIIDPAVKYGGGPAAVQDVLSKVSTQIQRMEEMELALIRAREAHERTEYEMRVTRDEFVRLMHSIIKKVHDTGLGAFS